MPIDSTTSIERLELGAGIAGGVYARVQYTHNPPSRRRTPESLLPKLANGTYDATDPEVAEVIKRVRNGLEVVYVIRDAALNTSGWAATTVSSMMFMTTNCPKPTTYLRDTHPFHANFVAERDKSRGPYVDVFYQRATAAPALTTAMFTGLESVGAYERRVENTDWLQTPPTGNDTLWYSVVRYGVLSTGVGWTDVEIARDTDINWSTDFGGTWQSFLPADYDDVTDVRVRYGTVWTDIPVFVDPDTNSPWLTLSVHNDIVPLPTDGLICAGDCWRCAP